ncbi:MAG: carboxypeptidase-like regulatory domain-containing protein, partial [Cyclobacteriaceae bacterium]
MIAHTYLQTQKIEKKMKRTILLSAILLLTTALWAQTTQTIRGKVIDEVSKTPLIGVNVVIVSDGGTLLGASSDENGDYRIANVPLGRQTIKVSYIGYEEQLIPNIIVTAGKEVILNLSLTESANQLNEVV